MKKKITNQIKKTQSGFTLVELMFVTLILAIFSIFLISFSMTSQTALEVGRTAVSTRADAKQAMEAMIKELREASLKNGKTIQLNPDGTPGICFKIPLTVSQSAPTSWKQIKFTYNSAAKRIDRIEINSDNCSVACSTGNCATFARNVQSLQFTKTNDVVDVTISANETTAGGRSLVSTLTSQVTVRN